MRRLRGIRWESPILNRELRTLLRSQKSFFWLILFLGIMLIIFATAWSTVRGSANRDLAARRLFQVVVISEGLLFSFLAPILTAGSLSGEHERRTYLLLATTPLSGYHVALAKCFSALCYVLLLVVATIPVLAITYMIGGVDYAELIAAAIGIIVTVSVAGMTGVAVSAWVRRTHVSVMVSIVLVVAVVLTMVSATATAAVPIGFIFMGATGPASYSSMVLMVVLCYSAVMGLTFLGLTRLAHNGYLAGAHMAPVRPKRVIRSRVVLKERQRRFPYYLIDPLKAPEPIPDGANPIYVRDKRHQPLGRLDFVFRVSYICLFASVFIGLWLIMDRPNAGRYDEAGEFMHGMIGVAQFASFIILLAAPLFASMAFTNEKEHDTFLPMMTTLIPPSRVLWAKMKIILRYSGVLLGSLFFPAFLVCSFAGNLYTERSSYFGINAPAAMLFLKSLLWLAPFFLILIVASGLLGLLISAASRRNMQSLTITYLVLILICFGPMILGELLEGSIRPDLMTFSEQGLSPLDLLFMSPLTFVCWGAGSLALLLNPFYFLAAPDEYAWISAMGCYLNPGQAALYVGLWAAIVAALYAATLRALHRAIAGGKV